MTAGPRAARLLTHIEDTEVTAVGKPRPQVIEDEEQQRVFGRVAASTWPRRRGWYASGCPAGMAARASKVWEVTGTMGAVTELAGS